jgi:hypothetical protein
MDLGLWQGATHKATCEDESLWFKWENLHMGTRLFVRQKTMHAS